MLLQPNARRFVYCVDPGKQAIGSAAGTTSLPRNVLGAEMQARQMMGGQTFLSLGS